MRSLATAPVLQPARRHRPAAARAARRERRGAAAAVAQRAGGCTHDESHLTAATNSERRGQSGRANFSEANCSEANCSERLPGQRGLAAAVTGGPQPGSSRRGGAAFASFATADVVELSPGRFTVPLLSPQEGLPFALSLQLSRPDALADQPAPPAPGAAQTLHYLLRGRASITADGSSSGATDVQLGAGDSALLQAGAQLHPVLRGEAEGGCAEEWAFAAVQLELSEAQAEPVAGQQRPPLGVHAVRSLLSASAQAWPAEPVAAHHPQVRRLSQADVYRLPGQSNRVALVFDPVRQPVAFTFSVEMFESGHVTPRHQHAQGHELFVVLSGEGTAACGDATWPIRAGDAVVFPPCTTHGIDVGPQGRMYALQLLHPNDSFAELVRTGAGKELQAEDLCALIAVGCAV